jgi:hypothetical protein
MTSDIAIDLGTDLVLIEVVSARLTAQMQVFGNRELLEQDLERMLFKKMKQLARVTGDLISGEATIPDVDLAHVERIWPVLVTAGELTQTEMLWDQIDARVPRELTTARIQTLSVFDIGDFELLLALVSSGEHLPEVLRRRASGPYRRLEIARFAADELHVDATVRLPVIEERYSALWQEMLEVLSSGWTLPEFMADELVACREGYLYEENDNAIFNVFNRRSGAIAAAIAMTLEAPDAIEQ